MDLALASLLVSFLGPPDQVEGIEEAKALIRGRAKLGNFVPPSHCIPTYLCFGSLGPLPHSTPQRASSPRTKARTEHLMTTNSRDPSSWRSGVRGEAGGLPCPGFHLLWKWRICAPQLEPHVLGPVLEFSLSLSLGSSSNGVLCLDTPTPMPYSAFPPPPSSYIPIPHPPPIPSLANTSEGSAFLQSDPRVSDLLHSSVGGGRFGAAPTCCHCLRS